MQINQFHFALLACYWLNHLLSGSFSLGQSQECSGSDGDGNEINIFFYHKINLKYLSKLITTHCPMITNSVYIFLYFLFPMCILSND